MFLVLRLEVLEFNMIWIVKLICFFQLTYGEVICVPCISRFHTPPFISIIYFLLSCVTDHRVYHWTKIFKYAHLFKIQPCDHGMSDIRRNPKFLFICHFSTYFFLCFVFIQNYINICKTTPTTWSVCIK